MKKIFFLLLLGFTGMTVTAQQTVYSPAAVQKPAYFDVSPPLRDLAALKNFRADNSWKDGIVRNHFYDRNKAQGNTDAGFRDLQQQYHFGTTVTDTTIANFEGLSAGNAIPPDTYGETGPDHYFQVVNCAFAVYNKSGNIVLGPLPNSIVWSGMPNNANSGDAVVVYDETANRWLFSQFSLPFYPNGPFYQMIAVSQTPDPTGSWFRYQYTFTSMPDYPKFGVWPDGYYMSCNRFGAGSGGFAGAGAAAFDRTKMLAGDPTAQMIWFALSNSNEAYSLLPSDCDGPFPPAGTPNYFTYLYGGTPSHLGILEFHADWTTPANATLGNLLSLPINAYNGDLGSGITQKGTTQTLEALSDRLMYRLQFRKFNDHWSMLCNHSVNAGGNKAGVRWYELRKTTGTWSVYQQATYAPADNNSRWMGSMAMDTAGTIALGFSIAGTNLYPSIAYTGRMRSDPLNTMTISEKRIINGGGCQTSSIARWGDYSGMSVDPASPTTFWYTTEYYSTTSGSSWQTRVGSFTFQNIFSTYAAASPEKVCAGDSSQLSSGAYGGSGSYTYAWTSIPSGFTSTLRNPKVSPSDTTIYVAAISDGAQTRHDTTHVAVLLPPTAFAGNDTTVCSWASSIDLHAVASNYRWFGWGSSGNGSFTDHSSLNTVYSFGSHDYQVDSVNLYLIVFANAPCSGRIMSTRHIKLDPCTGIQTLSAGNLNLVLQPNPARESVSVLISGITGKSALVSISNMKGQPVYAEEIPASAGSVTQKLTLGAFSPGVYFVKVMTDNKVITKELVVAP